MKAACFSDTHHTPPPISLPEADFGIFAGDCSMPGKEAELRSFVQWYAQQPVTHKIFVPGNHDWFTERQEEKTKGIMAGNGIIYLNNSGVTLDGISIWGTAVQPFFCNWAWNYPYENVREDWYSKIPDGVDILVTHCPPYGILDENPCGDLCGCPALRRQVIRAAPRFHVFGHIHCARGIEKAFGTTFVNASICTEAYTVGGDAIIIDLDRPTWDLSV